MPNTQYNLDVWGRLTTNVVPSSLDYTEHGQPEDTGTILGYVSVLVCAIGSALVHKSVMAGLLPRCFSMSVLSV